MKSEKKEAAATDEKPKVLWNCNGNDNDGTSVKQAIKDALTDMENIQKGARSKRSCTMAQMHQENTVTRLICDNKLAKKRSIESLKRIEIVDTDSVTSSIQYIGL